MDTNVRFPPIADTPGTGHNSRMTDGRPHTTKDRLSAERMEQLVDRPISVWRASGLAAAEKDFDALLTAAVEAHGSGSVEEADLLTSFGVELFLDTIGEDDPGVRKASVDYLKRAIPAYRAAFGTNHPEVAVALNSYADALFQVEGEAARPEAYSALEEAYFIRLATLGPDHPETMSTADRLGKHPEKVLGDEVQQPNSPNQMYLDLRDLALGTKASELALTTTGPKDAYGVIMDIDVGGRTATITSFGTGDASFYVSTGGARIGSGQASEEVAAGANQFVAAARLYVHSMEKASTQPLPGPGEVTFYVLTPEGIYTATGPEQALRDKTHGLSLLYYAGQGVLTQIRLFAEQQERERQQRNR